MNRNMGIDIDDAPERFDPEIHDALVLVHPAWGNPVDPDYHGRLIKDVEHALDSNKKVFYIKGPGINETMVSELEKRDLIDMPDIFGNFGAVHKKRILKLRAQREVDLIAGHIGKAPKDIRLGFGGMFSWGGIYDQIQLWCRLVVPRLARWDWRREYLPKYPIARGDMILEIIEDDYSDNA